MLVAASYDGMNVQCKMARLQHATFLNGLKGTIVGFEEHTDRFLIDVSGNPNIDIDSTDVILE